MKSKLVLLVIAIVTLVSCDNGIKKFHSIDIKSRLKKMKMIKSKTGHSADFFDPMEIAYVINQVSAFETFRIDSLDGYITENGMGLYFKRKIFKDFLLKYSSNTNFNKIVIKFTEISGAHASTIPYYGANNKKLHYLFYAGHYDQAKDSLGLIDSVAYDLCEDMSFTAIYPVSEYTESGFHSAYKTGGNLTLLNNLKPTRNSAQHLNTKFIQINKNQFDANFINSADSYEYVYIVYGLSRVEDHADLDHEDFLNLLFFRTNIDKQIIEELNVYDMNDICPPKCPLICHQWN